MREKHWSDYLWAVEICYLITGFLNILFAWLGLIFFFTPLLISIFGGGKLYCNKYCGRGKLFALLGEKMGASAFMRPPVFLRSVWFRYGFLFFFLIMFSLMLYSTYLVARGGDLKQVVTLLWVFNLPWHWANVSTATHPGVVQFAHGFYSVMLTSTILGLGSMVLARPRTWCVYCPMGTMTQGICKMKKVEKLA
jgi:hypothetical protein